MSNGPFTNTFYEMDNGQIINARVQPETIAVGLNEPPAGPATFGIRVNISSTKRNGVNARQIFAKWTVPPVGEQFVVNGRIKIAIMDKESYDAVNNGDTITYLGGTAVVTGKRGEKVV